MAYSAHFTPSRSSKGGGGKGGSGSSKLEFGIVQHIILSLEDPLCKDATMVNGVYYRSLAIATDESNVSSLPFAKQSSTGIKMLPVVGEMVLLEPQPASGVNGSPGQSNKCWTKIIPVWNHPHHNANPDTKQGDWENSLLGGVKESATINAAQANPGDMLIEGRLGQSIRIGGNKGAVLPFIDGSNDGKPIIIISNGQIETTNGTDLIQEDINKDPSSLYFVTDHKLPLEAANTKRDSYTTVPITSDQYKGNQVLLNGGRVFVNAKEESVFISAKESVGINGKTVNIDAQEYYCIDANKIYLGKGARAAGEGMGEPVILGKQLENWLGILLDSLDSLSTALTSAVAVTGGPVTQLNSAGPSLKATVTSLRSQIKQFQSNKVYTE